jgi:DNA gyrase/topoisomerase IV subunit B
LTAPALQPVTLAGTHVRLEPLSRMHAEALWEVARDPELWRWTSVAIETRAALDDYIAVALADRVAGRAKKVFSQPSASLSLGRGAARFSAGFQLG